jgi:hypothetical protein
MWRGSASRLSAIGIRKVAADELQGIFHRSVGHPTDTHSHVAHDGVGLEWNPREAFVSGVTGVSFDTGTVQLMRLILEETAAKLPTHLRTSSIKIELAELILKAAAQGERDPTCLRNAALIGVMARHRPSPSADGVPED